MKMVTNLKDLLISNEDQRNPYCNWRNYCTTFCVKLLKLFYQLGNRHSLSNIETPIPFFEDAYTYTKHPNISLAGVKTTKSNL